MTEVRTVARQIQQLEIYLNNLVSALTRGELPVNLQPVTQIFDRAIASIPPTLNLSQDRFIELYNDLPHLFTAYAIDVTLSEDSYHRQSNEIIFHRFLRGNYWIIPTQFAPDKGWLVPNPTKGVSIERMTSLETSFDRDIVPNNSHDDCLLVAPALVQILPIAEPLTWKLIERGKITNTQIQSSATTARTIESLVQKLVSLNDRILQIERGAITSQTITTIVDKQEQLQSISAKIIEQLVTKKKDVEALTSELAESIARSTRQEQEIATLKAQIGSIDTTKNSNAIEELKITSLKVELEKLKADYQSYKRQQDKNNQKLEDNIKLLVVQEITKLQSVQVDREIETIDAEIVIQEQKPQQNNIPALTTSIAPDLSSQMSPFARLYNTGKVEFLRSYMVSTASLIKNKPQTLELGEDNIGLYWIVPFNSTTHYLVPKINFPNDDKYLEGLASLFDGNNTTSWILFKPAIVTITKANMPKRWKLEQKGCLVTNSAV